MNTVSEGYLQEIYDITYAYADLSRNPGKWTDLCRAIERWCIWQAAERREQPAAIAWTGADDLAPIEPADPGSVYAEHIWQATCPAYRDERGYLIGPGERWCRVVRRDGGRFLQLQQGKLPVPQNGAEADERADVSWPLWQDADYLLGQELLALKAKVESGSIGPFPEEPLAGSPEAVAAAVRKIASYWPDDAARLDFLEEENERLREQLAERIRRHEADARDLESCRRIKEEETADASKAWALVNSLANALERYVLIEEQAAPYSSSPLRETARRALALVGRLP